MKSLLSWRTALLVVLFLAAALGTQAHAQTLLYSQAVIPDDNGVGPGGLLAIGSSCPFNNTSAEDFTLAQSTSITRITWEGVYYGAFSDFPGVDNNFHITFYEDNGAGNVGAVVADFPSVAVIKALNPRPPIFGTNPVYTYDVTLPSSVSVTGGQRYWLSINGDPNGPTGPVFGWVSSNEGNAAVIPGNDQPLQNDSIDCASLPALSYTPGGVAGDQDADLAFALYGEESQCTLTPGYWKNHEDTWIGIDTSTPFFLSGQSYYEVLWTAPRGNVYYILAHQYIAAELNFLNGADPSSIQTAFDEATQLFNTYTPEVIAAAKGKVGQALRDDFTTLASILDNYNSGLAGPGSCNCPCWTGQDLAELTASSCVQSPDGEYISVETYENFTLSTYDSEFPGCDVVDHNQNIGFAIAITYDQFLDCRGGLEKLRNEAGLTCTAP
ncbi:MAG: hypothetical protein PVJ36_04275 [Nitrospirota bacterium]|jgi:hypothetical protein